MPARLIDHYRADGCAACHRSSLPRCCGFGSHVYSGLQTRFGLAGYYLACGDGKKALAVQAARCLVQQINVRPEIRPGYRALSAGHLHF
jgi:hypothetical protein